MKIKLAILSLVLFVTPFVNAQDASTLPSKEISHTFYATGNLGTEKSNQNNSVLNAITDDMANELNSTLLLLGNNSGENGFSGDNLLGKDKIDSYANILKPYANKVIFVPGSKDWHSGLKDLRAQEDYLKKKFKNKNVFQPKKGCPIEKIKINADVDLLILDSQWALSD